MWSVAERSQEPQTVGPARSARAEAAWLAGDLAMCAVEARAGLEALSGTGQWWATGELAVLLLRSEGMRWERGFLSEPHRLWLEGEHELAAKIWRSNGCVYAEADALADCDDEESLRRAFAVLDELGRGPVS